MKPIDACVNPDELGTLVHEPGTEGEARRIDLALHLVEGCPSCRSALSGPPRDRLSVASLDPVAEALARLASPGSWAILPSTLLEAVLRAATEPRHLVDLVLAEAMAIGLGEPEVDLGRIFAPATRLVARLGDERGPRTVLWATLATTAAIRREVASAQAWLAEARTSLGRVANALTDVDGAVRRASLAVACARGDGLRALHDLEALLRLLRPDERPLARSGLLVELASVMTHAPGLVELALGEAFRLLDAEAAASPMAVLRLHAVYRRAHVLARVGRRVHARTGELLSGLESAARELARTRADFAIHADATSVAFRDLCLGQLWALLGRTGLATAALLSALEGFEALGLTTGVDEVRRVLAESLDAGVTVH